ncbi:hypothetical protein OCU04_008528 [Sclerotinia nivalis]|uniref:Rhodopsin domain-containing protein n=1 Tax=Sclerotinia nivalis TaxID=352851 RepID=A0A9X0ALT3_9HELO|nr:hypothetical protein OCU04_008528 [Sclerotinia nivalis]
MPSSGNSGYSPLTVSAGKVPPGLSAHDRYSSYHGVPMTVVLSVFAGIAVIFYCIRLHTKIIIVRKVGWDDLVCTLGMFGMLVDLTCFGIATIDGPLGKHMWNITLGEFLGNNFVVTAFIMQVIGSLTLGLIKLSIFLFYYQIFWPLKWCRWVICIGASLNSAFYLSMTVVQFYYESPRPGETLAGHFGGKMAQSITRVSIPTSSVGLAIDILLLIIPLRAVVQLQMAKKKKKRLFLTFFVGIMAVLGSILSLSFKIKTYGNPDITYNLVLVNFFICVEMVFGVCIASTPLVSRATSEHHFGFPSFVESISAPFHQLWKTLSGSSHDVNSLTEKSSGVHDGERGSDSNNQGFLVELDKHQPHPTQPDERV